MGTCWGTEELERYYIVFVGYLPSSRLSNNNLIINIVK